MFVRPGNDRVALQLSAMARQFVSGEDRTDVCIAASPRWTLNPSNALRADIAYRNEYRRDWLEAGVWWQHYF